MAETALTGQKQSADKIRIDDGVDAALIDEAAALTDGFSARELAKLVASMQV